jgi:molecular chaperone GrpE
MTDESETSDYPKLDDSRFEVKWKKKGSSSSPPPQTAEPRESATSDEEESVEDLPRRLAESHERIKDLQDKWHRAAADLANLRRRTEQERGDIEKFASMLLVAELLPVLDNFERALETIPGNLSGLTWIQGVMLIERHFRAILEHQGVAPIEAQGKPFSASYHEAISERETEDAEPGTVTQVYQKGYTMHGRVIRPALVELAKRPAGTSSPGGEETTSEDRDIELGGTTTPGAEEIARESAVENAGP